MKKILIVDDDADNRLILRIILEDDYEVEEAGNDNEALAKIESLEPSIMITDLVHPPGSGIHLLRWVSEHKPSLPVIILTLAGGAREECLAHGAFAFVQKPILDMWALLAPVNNAMELVKDGKVAWTVQEHECVMDYVERKLAGLDVVTPTSICHASELSINPSLETLEQLINAGIRLR